MFWLCLFLGSVWWWLGLWNKSDSVATWARWQWGHWRMECGCWALLLAPLPWQCLAVIAMGRGHAGSYSRASVLLHIQTPVPSQYCAHRGMPLITLNRQMHDANWKFQTYGHARSFVSLVGEVLEMSWGVTKTCCYPKSAFEWCVSTCLK